MEKRKYLIACYDEQDQIYEMKEVYLLLMTSFPTQGFKLNKQKSEIENDRVLFQFMTPNQMNYLGANRKFCGVAETKKFREFASFDSKFAYRYFKVKVRKVGSDGLLKKISKARWQSNR